MELNLLLLILLLLKLSISSSLGPICNEPDQVALLQFKNSFSLDHTNCPNPNPRLLSWVLHNETENTAGCCSWEGVTCELRSGHSMQLTQSSNYLACSSSTFQGMTLLGLKFRPLLVTLTWISAHINWTMETPMRTDIKVKGMDREYDHVSNMMVFLSLSGNKFVGEIPESVGNLVGLHGLDLSNNNLTGSIPPTLGELKQLESLDLSLNMLSGEFPQQLSQLTFLGYLNLSYNNLSGTIPEGEQLDTFGNSSFEGNPGLSRLPLSNRRGSANEPSTGHEGRNPGSSDHSKLVLGFEGFATGLAVGLGIGYIITTRNHQWFVKTCLKLRYRKQ